MIQLNGEPPTAEEAAKLRKIAEKYGIKKTARCRECDNNQKQFNHMAFLELKRIMDLKTKVYYFQYVGLCCNCLFESSKPKKGIEVAKI